MIFSDSYKESDKVSRHRLMVAGLVILIVVSFMLTVSFLRKDESPEAIETTLAISPGLRRVNELCNNLPKPEGLQFVDKKIGGNSVTYAIEFNYKRNKSSKEINAFYLQWFNENGWSLEKTDTLRFGNGNQRISISNETFSTSNFGIYCAELFGEN